MNRVPLIRVPQSRVIATSTKLDISSLDLSINDTFFSSKNTENKEATQKTVDDKLEACIEKTPLMKEYLHARFVIGKGSRPHDMKF